MFTNHREGIFVASRAKEAHKQEGVMVIRNLGIELEYRIICGRKMQLLLQINPRNFRVKARL